MKIIQENSCISFREIGRNECKPVHRLKVKVISPNQGCKGGEVDLYGCQQSQVVLTLLGGGCPPGVILHKLGHVLGLWSQKTRRDQFVRIVALAKI